MSSNFLEWTVGDCDDLFISCPACRVASWSHDKRQCPLHSQLVLLIALKTQSMLMLKTNTLDIHAFVHYDNRNAPN